MKQNIIQNIVIAGPTASGKTKLSIDIALKVNGEIINADSMQVYRGLNKINAMPSKENLKLVPHHLFSINELDVKFSVAEWIKLASKIKKEINNTGKPVIFAGGSGMYLNAAINGLSKIPKIKIETKKRVEKLYQNIGKDKFYSKLCNLDPNVLNNIERNDTYRVLRSFEVVLQTGKTLSWWHKQKKISPIVKNAKKILIMPSKKEIYARIDKRFDLMINDGAIEEVRNVFNKNLTLDLPSLKTLGVKQLFSYFKNLIPIDEAIMLAKRDSRRFAKRQLTWFKNSFEPDIILSEVYNGKIKDINFNFL